MNQASLSLTVVEQARDHVARAKAGEERRPAAQYVLESPQPHAELEPHVVPGPQKLQRRIDGKVNDSHAQH